jgi:enterochelin esterase-like enzyme
MKHAEFIDKNFRTMPTPDNRAVQGYSMGGVGAWYLVHHYPNVFGCLASHDGFALSYKEELQAVFTPFKNTNVSLPTSIPAVIAHSDTLLLYLMGAAFLCCQQTFEKLR